MKRFIFIFVLCWYGTNIWAQTEVRGRVMHDTIPLSGVHVLNLYTHAITTTDANGYFTLKARERHTLQFTFVGMETVYRVLTKTDFGFGGLNITMNIAVNQLDEVQVSQYRKLSAQELGILQHTPQERTFAEKRLYASKGLGIVSILNTLSGKKKVIKKIVANEKNLAVAQYIRENMSPFLQKELKLNEEEIDILAYFVMERADFHELVRKKDNKPMEFMLLEAWNEVRTAQASN